MDSNEKNPKILMFSGDPHVANKESWVTKRLFLYSGVTDYLDVIVLLPLSFSDYVKERLSVFSTHTTFKLFSYILGFFRALFLKKTYTLITSHDPFFIGIIAYAVSRLKGVPLEIQIHTDIFSPYFEKSGALQTYRLKIADFLLKRAERIRVVAPRLKEAILKKYKERKEETITVLPVLSSIGEIDAHRPQIDLHKKYPQFDFIMLMLSRLESEKSIMTALLAFKEVIKEYPHIGLVIVGNGSQKGELQNFCKEHNLPVIFEGWTEDPYSYFKTADLFLLTSLFEGYGLTLIEAAAAHCPIVTTDVGLVGSILTDDAVFVCPPEDATCLAERVTALLGNAAVRSARSIAAFKEIKKHVIENPDDFLPLLKKSWTV